MRIQAQSHVDLQTPSGPMRTHLFRPDGPGRYPGVILFSEIYQMTAPIARTAALIAGHGLTVAVPDVYHEYTELGEAFQYDKEGTDRGNKLKIEKEISAYDADARTVIDFFLQDEHCTDQVGSVGICLGGHLAFRAAMNPEVKSGVCFYATDIHKRSLGRGMNDNTLDRMDEVHAEMMMVWGRQDPHISGEGRRLIYDAMTSANIHFSWHEFNGEHAFMRDEGHRYDPELALLLNSMMCKHLNRHLK
ncbi:dienelactone hydrolase family protein [Rhodopirellula halodulae]|uniref:dienelactone hydrolase family protein n=1 Tax=Rhodopirellula halodulae TaxID=2894198 RepID=UPI001E654B62|nr:dienelactone hydrolase family protein [Rhodopirellula sp. JC737]MCC9657235.1 dienelactone hydrolase family protein [Rhodopirellula sp. JC737]